MSFAERLSTIKNIYSTVEVEKIRKIFKFVDGSVEKLESLQHHFYQDKKIAVVALLHRSALVYWPHDKSGVTSNECLEFLGDSFLNFYVATELMAAHPEMDEGDLSKLRAAIVSTDNLALKAKELKIESHLLLGKGEVLSSQQAKSNALADAFESITAALLLDGGDAKVRTWLSEVFAVDILIGKSTLQKFDVKTQFQQWTQSIIGVPPTYKVVGTVGTPQDTQFIVAGFIGETEIERATASSKKLASKLVAEKMQKLVDDGTLTKEMILKIGGET